MCDIVCTLFTSKYEVSLSSEPPHVSLSEEKLVFRDELPQKLSCHCKNYYPLNVQVCLVRSTNEIFSHSYSQIPLLQSD